MSQLTLHLAPVVLLEPRQRKARSTLVMLLSEPGGMTLEFGARACALVCQARIGVEGVLGDEGGSKSDGKGVQGGVSRG